MPWGLTPDKANKLIDGLLDEGEAEEFWGHSIRVDPEADAVERRAAELVTEARRAAQMCAEARKPYADLVMKQSETIAELSEKLAKRDDRIAELEHSIRDFFHDGMMDALFAQVDDLP